jgi:hypothetical protein
MAVAPFDAADHRGANGATATVWGAVLSEIYAFETHTKFLCFFGILCFFFCRYAAVERLFLRRHASLAAGWGSAILDSGAVGEVCGGVTENVAYTRVVFFGTIGLIRIWRSFWW